MRREVADLAERLESHSSLLSKMEASLEGAELQVEVLLRQREEEGKEEMR